MAMGKRKPRQESLFITTDQLTTSVGHPFYQRLNALLAENGFDDWIERRCAAFYTRKEPRGRPSLPPGVYFRMLLVGYFEGLDSPRGIAWRCADRLSLRAFLGLPLDQATPDHSTLTNTRQRLPEAVFDEVFRFVLGIAEANKRTAGTTVGVDSTRLEANAAMTSIVRRDTGDNWKQYVAKLMRAAGEIGPAEEPSNEAARRFDQKRKGKKVSDEEWKSSTDADARIAHRKDGTTHLAYKAEHVVDLDSDLVLAAEIRLATDGDTATLAESVLAAQENLELCGSAAVIEDVAADKGYHAAQALETCADFEWRTYIPEPRRTHPITRSNRSDAPRGAQQPDSDASFEEQTIAAAAQRSRGAHVRACVRDGRGAPEPSAWIGERDQAVPAGGGRSQPGSNPADAVRDWEAAVIAGGGWAVLGPQTAPMGSKIGLGTTVAGLGPRIRSRVEPPRRLRSLREKRNKSTGC